MRSRRRRALVEGLALSFGGRIAGMMLGSSWKRSAAVRDGG
jgi:hypothetical protein